MTAHYLGNPRFREFDDNGDPLAGGKLWTYAEGTSTPKASYTDASGTVENTNPVILDAGGAAAVWLTGRYKLKLLTANDVPRWTMDNVAGVGFVDPGDISDEWSERTEAPTFIDATNFSVPGDLTTVYQANRRIRATVDAGTLYGRVTASAFTTVTTVTVAWDTGTLDAGLSAVAIGFISVTNKSVHWQAIDGIAAQFSAIGANDSFAPGTRMLFQSATTPTGWTRQAVDDKALRVVSGSIGQGGTVAFSAAFTAAKATGGHALTAAENGPHTHQTQGAVTLLNASTGANPVGVGDTAFHDSTPSGSGTPHTHPLELELAYVDVYVAEKNPN